MKDVEFIVIKNKDEAVVADAFEKYFDERDLKSLINLTYRVLALAMVEADIDCLHLGIEKIMPYGLFYNDKITLNRELFKKPKDLKTLILILNTIFHELAHAVLHRNNIKILTTRQNIRNFLPMYDVGKITRILNIMCGDYEFACAGASYFYRKNKNEYLARKNAYDMTNIFLEKFANGYSFNIPTFEQQEQTFINTLYKDFPCIRYNEEVAARLLSDYQSKIICGGIDCAQEAELRLLVASINVMLGAENRYNLIGACAKSTDIKKVNMLLNTPLIEIDQRERELLARFHDERVLDQILFYREGVQRSC